MLLVRLLRILQYYLHAVTVYSPWKYLIVRPAAYILISARLDR